VDTWKDDDDAGIENDMLLRDWVFVPYNYWINFFYFMCEHEVVV